MDKSNKKIKMGQQIKFTSDGKKVIVIGSLNSKETIVQEIFIVDGSEIPSGEHFVTKSLHDSPAVSWKEQELINIEKRYSSYKESCDIEMIALRKSFEQKSSELRAKLNYIGSALKNASEDSFEMLVDYLTGEIEWIVIDHYTPELLSINVFHQMYDGKLRLISFFGKDDGSFNYAIGEYHDHSGGHKKFIPFKNYEDAHSEFKRIVISKDVTHETIGIAKKYGFELPHDRVSTWRQKQIETTNKNIASYKEQIEKWESALGNI